MERRDSATVDSVYSLVGVLAQGLARFAYTAIVARLLGASALADVNLALAVAILLSLLWPTAAGNAAAAFARGDDVRFERSLLRGVLISLIPLAAVGAAVAGLVGGGAEAAVQTAMSTVAWSAYIFGRGVFIGGGRFRTAAVWDVVTGIGAIGALFGFIALGWTSWILIPLIVGYLVFATVALATRNRAHASLSAGDGSRVRLTHFIVWNSLALIATNGLMQGSMVVASAFDTPARAGQFAAALSLATPVSMVAQAVTQAMLPRFGRWSSLPETERLARVRRSTIVLGVLMAGGSLLVALVVPWVLPLVYGVAFTPAVPLAQGLMVAVFAFSMSVFFAAYLATVGRARLSTGLTGIGSAVGVATMLVVAATETGSVGAVVGAGAGMVVSLVLLGWAVLIGPRRDGPRPRLGAVHG